MLSHALRTVIIYFTVILAIRIMGKRQIGDMQPGDLAITILVSELAAEPIVDSSSPLLFGLIPVATLVLLELIVSRIVLKSIFVRRLMNGYSAVVIRDGVVDQKLLARLRVSVDDLLEILRSQQVFDISTVAFGILETNGNLSVLLKSGEQPIKVSDTDIKPRPAAIPVPLITDGTLRKDEMRFASVEKERVEKLLKEKGLRISDVFLMTMDSDGKTVIIKKTSDKSSEAKDQLL